MISRWARPWFGRVAEPAVRLLARLGATADHLTLAGLLMIVAGGALFALGAAAWGAILLLFGNLLDSLDGEMARSLGRGSPAGPFIDSVSDHYGDFAIYLGLLWAALLRGDRLQIVLLFVAMFGSLVGSHIRSRAGMLGIDTKNVGIFTRLERTVILAGGVFLRQLTPALVILAIFNNLSALQRIAFVLRANRSSNRELDEAAVRTKSPH